MDLLLIVRDALSSSLAGGLLVALEARKAGREVGVLVTQEALAALARGSFGWPRELSGQQTRLVMADRGAAADLPLLGRGEGRQLDVKGLVSRAREAGVAVYACPIWSSLLDLEEKLPEGLQAVEQGGVSGLIQRAERIVGSF
jgi:peroxiredoxin family protein